MIKEGTLIIDHSRVGNPLAVVEKIDTTMSYRLKVIEEDGCYGEEYYTTGVELENRPCFVEVGTMTRQSPLSAKQVKEIKTT
jgi:hypothetical protein